MQTCLWGRVVARDPYRPILLSLVVTGTLLFTLSGCVNEGRYLHYFEDPANGLVQNSLVEKGAITIGYFTPEYQYLLSKAQGKSGSKMEDYIGHHYFKIDLEPKLQIGQVSLPGIESFLAGPENYFKLVQGSDTLRPLLAHVEPFHFGKYTASVVFPDIIEEEKPSDGLVLLIKDSPFSPKGEAFSFSKEVLNQIPTLKL